MASSFVGIDIGSSQLKLAVTNKGQITALIRDALPEDLVQNGHITSFDAMSEYLRDVFKKNRIDGRKCAVLLPDELVFVRPITMPYMKPEQLKVNLPYEFHDFIADDKNKYVYDYAFLEMREMSEGSREMELIAAAAQKSVIDDYKTLLKRAGLKLATAIPYVMSYSNIINSLESRKTAVEDNGIPTEYCFIDLGHVNSRINIFSGRRLVATKIIEYGLNMLDAAIAEGENVDIHIAKMWKENNHNNVLERENCVNVYNAIAIEIMRAVNFYRFNNQESLLSDAYVCGGGEKIESLLMAIRENTDLTILPVNTLLQCPEKFGEEAGMFCCAIGATRQ